MTILFHELPVGETLMISGTAKVTIMQKTGKKVRLRIESDKELTIQNLNQAQKCRNEGEATNG